MSVRNYIVGFVSLFVGVVIGIASSRQETSRLIGSVHQSDATTVTVNHPTGVESWNRITDDLQITRVEQDGLVTDRTNSYADGSQWIITLNTPKGRIILHAISTKK